MSSCEVTNAFINAQGHLKTAIPAMTYEYLSDSELMHEIGMLDKLVGALASQAEKLTKIKSEGKASDSTYREVLEELRKRAAVTARKVDELISAADDRVKQINSQVAQFRYNLELLETRHAIGAIPDAKYKADQGVIQIQLNEVEGTKKRIVDTIAGIIENSRRIGNHIPGETRAMPQMPARPALEPVVRTVEADSVSPVKAFSQPKSEIRPVEVHSMSKAMTCSKCGKENPENASYCYYCGSRI